MKLVFCGKQPEIMQEFIGTPGSSSMCYPQIIILCYPVHLVNLGLAMYNCAIYGGLFAVSVQELYSKYLVSYILNQRVLQ